MKVFFKIIFSIIIVLLILGTAFYMIDTTRVHSSEEPIFTFVHKIYDGKNFSAKVDSGLGYKIIRFEQIGNEEKIKVGTIFMKEDFDEFLTPEKDILDISGESGEIIAKKTTFGEAYEDIVLLEGEEETVDAKLLNSKLGYSMTYYYDLFDYVGFEDYDLYTWNLTSGEEKATLTIYDISDEEAYEDALKNITTKDLFEEISGDSVYENEKLYYRAFEEDRINKVNYISIVEFEDLKLMIDKFYLQEASEGIGIYMSNMANSIKIY